LKIKDKEKYQAGTINKLDETKKNTNPIIQTDLDIIMVKKEHGIDTIHMENSDDGFHYDTENKKFDTSKNRRITKNDIENDAKDDTKTIRNVNANLKNIRCATKAEETYPGYHVSAYNKEIEQEEKRNIAIVDIFNLLESYVVENSTFPYEHIIDPIQPEKDSKKTKEENNNHES